MAEEIVQILKFQTQEAVKSVADLRDNVKAYKEQLADLEIGSEEYQDTLKNLTENQKALRQAMFATNSTMEEVTEQAKGMGDSYNALVNKMAELKKQWRATSDEAERGKIGVQIRVINQQLKDLDASVGNYQRNVGDYTRSIEDAFSAMGGSARGVVGPINGVTNAFNVMSKTPVIAIIGAIVAVLQKVISALNTSEENVKAVTLAFAPFKSLGDVVTRTMQGLASVLGKVGDWLQKITQRLGLWTDAMQAHVDLQQMENDLLVRQREILIENAGIEQRVAELREKSKEADIYSEKQRLAFLNEAMGLEKQISENEREIAQRELDIIQKRMTFSGNSTEALQQEAEAQVKLIQVETRYQDTMRGYQRERQSLMKAVGDEAEQQLQRMEGFDEEAVLHVKQTADLQTEVLATTIELDKKILEQGRKASHEAYQNMVKEQQDALKLRQQNIASFEGAVIKSLNAVSAGWLNEVQAQQAAGKISERAAQNQFAVIKSLNAASVMTDTIATAWSQYKSISAATGIFGKAAAIAQFAATLAKGTADMISIKNMTLGNSSAVTATGEGGTMSAIVSAPAVLQQVAVTRSLTSASEEERLNQMAAPQRVYVVYDDIAQAGTYVDVVQAESTF